MIFEDTINNFKTVWLKIKALNEFLNEKIQAEATARANADATLQSNINAVSTNISNINTDVSSLTTRIETAEGDISSNATQIGTKANQSDLSALTGRVTTAEGNISTNTTNIGTKANQSDLTNLTGRVTTAEGNISSNTTAISTKANQSDLTTLTGRVTTAEGNILTKANQTDLTTLTGRVTTAESNISTNTTNIGTKANANAVVDLTTAQNVGGVKTFTSIPVIPSTNPTTDNQATRKGYVDAQVATKITPSEVDTKISNATSGFVNLTTAQNIGGVKTFTSIPVLPDVNPTAGSNQAVRVKQLEAQVTALTNEINARPKFIKKNTESEALTASQSDPYNVYYTVET